MQQVYRPPSQTMLRLYPSFFSIVLTALVMTVFECIVAYKIIFPGVRQQIQNTIDKLSPIEKRKYHHIGTRELGAVLSMLEERELSYIHKINKSTKLFVIVLCGILFMQFVAIRHRMHKHRLPTKVPYMLSFITVTVLCIFQLVFIYIITPKYKFAKPGSSEMYNLLLTGMCEKHGSNITGNLLYQKANTLAKDKLNFIVENVDWKEGLDSIKSSTESFLANRGVTFPYMPSLLDKVGDVIKDTGEHLKNNITISMNDKISDVFEDVFGEITNKAGENSKNGANNSITGIDVNTGNISNYGLGDVSKKMQNTFGATINSTVNSAWKSATNQSKEALKSLMNSERKDLEEKLTNISQKITKKK